MRYARASENKIEGQGHDVTLIGRSLRECILAISEIKYQVISLHCYDIDINRH